MPHFVDMTVGPVMGGAASIPATAPSIVPDPDDPEQVDTVARALFELDKANWVAPDYSQHEAFMRGWARQTLTALRSLAQSR